MASISTPLIFSQSSPYIRGTITYKWFDADAVSAITGGNASANGISSITLNQSSANLVIAFDSNSSATVDIEGATSSLALTVPNDYNENITVDVISELEVGKTHDVTTPVKKTIRHQFTGISDSTLTSSISNPQFNETEVVAGTGKSLGTYSVNDVDSSVTYTATVTYDKTIGSITYTDNSVVTNNSANDQIVTNSVSTLNHVLTTMAYVPLFQSNPSQNTDALQGQTITLAVENTKDKKINSQPVTISTTIDNTLQLTNSGPAPSFIDSDGSDQNAVGKSLGTIGISPSLNISGITMKANVTYDRTKGTITYPNSSIVTTQGSVDTISSSDIADINDALSNCTYVPTTISSGTDFERIEADTIQISVSSTPQLTIATPTTEVTTTVTNETEVTNVAAFGYTQHTLKTDVLSTMQITDTADANSGTTEIYAVVIDFNNTIYDHFTINSTTNVTSYDGTGTEASISNTAKIFQGNKADLNTALSTGGGFTLEPKHQETRNTQYRVTVYRAPDGTSPTIDINNNFSTFDKIFDSGLLSVTATTVNPLVLDSATVAGTEDSAISLPNGTITMTANATADVILTVTTSSTLDSGTGAGEFGTISSSSGTFDSANKKFTFQGTQSQCQTVLDALEYTPGLHTTGTVDLTIGTVMASAADPSTPDFTAPLEVTINTVAEQGFFRSIDQQSSTLYYQDTLTNLYRNIIVDTDQSPIAHDCGIEIVDDTDASALNTNISASVTLSSDQGTLSSTGPLSGTFHSANLTYVVSGDFANVNATLQNLQFTNNSTITGFAKITASYTDVDHTTTDIETIQVRSGQSSGNNNSGSVILSDNSYLYLIEKCRADPVYVSTKTFTDDAYVYVQDDNKIVVYDDAVVSSGTPTNSFNEKTTITLDTFTETTESSSTYTGSGIDITGTTLDNLSGQFLMTTDTVGGQFYTGNIYVANLPAPNGSGFDNGTFFLTEGSTVTTLLTYGNENYGQAIGEIVDGSHIYGATLYNHRTSSTHAFSRWRIFKDDGSTNNINETQTHGATVGKLPTGTIKVHGRSLAINHDGSRLTHGYSDPTLTGSGYVGTQQRHWFNITTSTGTFVIGDLTSDGKLVIIKKN